MTHPPLPPARESTRARLTGVILAGGRGRRMGGRDKGLLPFCGRPLVNHVIEWIRPQVGALLISANRSLDTYGALGLPVVTDDQDEFLGPLAGIAAALRVCRTPLLLSVPCDSPYPPRDLAERLLQALNEAHAEVAVAHDGIRMHPVFALLRRELLPGLEASLSRGERGLGSWYRGRHLVLADFSDQAEAFVNLNTPSDWKRLNGTSD